MRAGGSSRRGVSRLLESALGRHRHQCPGRLIRTIGEAHHFDRAKRRDFQNDALIALTARRHGAVVVTTDARDLGLLGAALRVRVLNIRKLARVGEGTRA